MTVAALYDIHGNLPALEAVLAQVVSEGFDRIVVGGDVLPGPLPRACLEALAAVRIPIDFIHGNGDRDAQTVLEGGEPLRVPEAFREVVRWSARALTSPQAAALAAWPATVRQDVEGLGDVLFCHATPDSDNALFTRLTPEDRLRPRVEGTGADVVVCGHTHMQFDRTVGRVRVVNAGSVGMPFGNPGAWWLALGPDVRLRHTPYDLEAAAARIRASGYPQAETFATDNVLRVPAADTMERAFEKVALQPPPPSRP